MPTPFCLVPTITAAHQDAEHQRAGLEEKAMVIGLHAASCGASSRQARLSSEPAGRLCRVGAITCA